MPIAFERVSKVTVTGQTTVPKVIRDALGIENGGSISYRLDEHGVVSLTRHGRSEEAAIDAFLAFLSNDIKRRPDAVVPLSSEQATELRALTDGIAFDLDEDFRRRDRALMEVDGWRIYEHPEFARQRDLLQARVEALRRRKPEGYRHSADAKLLAAIAQLTWNDPCRSSVSRFRQGGTLGKHRKHWFRAKFGNGRYRLFFQFSSAQKVIIYAWINDANTLRTRGARTDAYAVFKAMLERGDPPDSWDALMRSATPATDTR